METHFSEKCEQNPDKVHPVQIAPRYKQAYCFPKTYPLYDWFSNLGVENIPKNQKLFFYNLTDADIHSDTS